MIHSTWQSMSSKWGWYGQEQTTLFFKSFHESEQDPHFLELHQEALYLVQKIEERDPNFKSPDLDRIRRITSVAREISKFKTIPYTTSFKWQATLLFIEFVKNFCEDPINRQKINKVVILACDHLFDDTEEFRSFYKDSGCPYNCHKDPRPFKFREVIFYNHFLSKMRKLSFLEFKQVLENCRLDINTKNTHKLNALMLLILYDDDSDKAKLLLDKGISIEDRNHDGHTAFMLAAKKGRLQIMGMMLSQHRIPLEDRDSKGNTALIIAAKFNKPDIIRFLLSQGADRQAVNTANETALTIAKKHQYPIESLLT